VTLQVAMKTKMAKTKEPKKVVCKFGGFCYIQESGKCSKCKLEPKVEEVALGGKSIKKSKSKKK